MGPNKVRLYAGNVKDDATSDGLLGQTDRDWFFAQLTADPSGKESPDSVSGETVIDID